ncbi:MAG: LysR family transcriptional regulator [Ramlibacter sp.]|jgi:DNA-binding transcriptional LysR family regulator|nr:LysR family transcriptional regulator [Ramlibacter sp.]
MEASAFEYFHAVARTGSISRAAGELGMEPSTLTRHIGRLEQDVGVKLFHRSGRGMVLTDAGTLLLQEASKVVDTLQHTRRVAADLAAEGPSQIVIAAQPTIAQVCFGAIARALRDRYPRARLRVTEGFGHELVGWLQEGKVDVALLYVPGQTPIADYELLLQEPLHCILPTGHVTPRAPLDSSLVLDLPLVLPSTPQGLRALAESWAQRHGKRLTLAMECDGSTFMTRRLVQAGLGCSILPLAAVHEDVSRGLLQAVRLEGRDALRAVALATAQNRPPVADLWQITRLLREVIAELVVTGQWPGVDRMAG